MLTLPDRKVLDALSLVENDTKLKSSVAFETTLDSVYFEQQHVQTSTGENMMIRNQSSGINFFPVWQSIDENTNLDTGGFKPVDKSEHTGAGGTPLQAPVINIQGIKGDGKK